MIIVNLSPTLLYNPVVFWVYTQNYSALWLMLEHNTYAVN